MRSRLLLVLSRSVRVELSADREIGERLGHLNDADSYLEDDPIEYKACSKAPQPAIEPSSMARLAVIYCESAQVRTQGWT